MLVKWQRLELFVLFCRYGIGLLRVVLNVLTIGSLPLELSICPSKIMQPYRWDLIWLGDSLFEKKVVKTSLSVLRLFVESTPTMRFSCD